MVAYLDSSAAVKLAHRENCSEALVAWLNARADLVMVSSVLVEVELQRALFRYDPAALAHVPGVVARLVRIELSEGIRSIAAAYRHATLRTLDAIHLATACFVSSHIGQTLDAFVAYDARLNEFALGEHLRVVSPGA